MAKAKLAASVVMTFSLVGAGCDADGKTVNPPPPPAEETVNPPAPERQPEPEPEPEPAPEPKVSHQVHPDGSCWKYVEPNCPPNTPCNPPPPQAVDCTEDMFPVASDPKMVAVRADGSCWEEPQVECEPGATCNPPPPQRVRCPEPKAEP